MAIERFLLKLVPTPTTSSLPTAPAIALGVERWTGTAALHAGNRRLHGPHSPRKLSLRQTRLSPQCEHQLPNAVIRASSPAAARPTSVSGRRITDHLVRAVMIRLLSFRVR